MSERINREMPSSAADLPYTIWKPAPRAVTAALLRMSGIDPHSSLDEAIRDLEPMILPPELLARRPEEDRLAYEATEKALASPAYGGFLARAIKLHASEAAAFQRKVQTTKKTSPLGEVLTWSDPDLLLAVAQAVGSSKAALVGDAGFEPTTSASRTRRATKLR
jgi:hypothetical protein